MARIIPRKEWGARHADGDLNLQGLAEAVVIHHTATATLPASASVNEEMKAMRNLEDIGRARFGHGISYNVVIFQSGRAYQGVSFNRRGTHTGGHNSKVRSISFYGNFENAVPTAEAVTTVREIVSEGRGKWWMQGAPVKGHRDYKATACPGRNVYALLGKFAEPVGFVSQTSAPKPAQKPAQKPSVSGSKSIAVMAAEVIAGQHGNGHPGRRKSLGVSAATYEQVRAEVNRRTTGRPTPAASRPAGKTISQMATEVIQGRHGNGHENRRKSLNISQATYQQVRAEVNRRSR